MANGTSVVAAANDGYHAVLGDCGLLYPPRDVHALQRCLSERLDAPTKRAELAHRGRERAARYDWPIVADAIEAVSPDALKQEFTRLRRSSLT